MPTTRNARPVPAAPRSTVSPSDVETLVAAAVLAPSMHNTQPWRFRLVDDALQLHVDAARTLRVTDPDGRALAISCGAALLGVRLAAAVALGREPVTRLLPHAAAPGHLATVRLAGRTVPSAADRRAYQALPRRRSDRAPYADRAVPKEVLDRLAEAARLEGAAVLQLDEAMTHAALQLTAEADREWAADAAYRAELAAWTEGTDRPDGIPAHAFGPRDHGGRLHLRDFGVLRRDYGQTATREAVFEKAPTLLVLSTRTDDVADRVRAGQALQRLLLEATAAGLSTSLLGQAVERRELRWLLRDPLHGVGVPQMLIRIGYGTVAGAMTPRRSVAEVLESAGSTAGDAGR